MRGRGSKPAARAFADQAAMIESAGGEAAIRATPPIAFTAPPNS